MCVEVIFLIIAIPETLIHPLRKLLNEVDVVIQVGSKVSTNLFLLTVQQYKYLCQSPLSYGALDITK